MEFLSDGSFVYVIDKNNKITYASYDYKGEGEKLRSVQKELFSQSISPTRTVISNE